MTYKSLHSKYTEQIAVCIGQCPVNMCSSRVVYTIGPGKSGSNLKCVIFKHISVADTLSYSNESSFLILMLPYGITKPQWVMLKPLFQQLAAV